MKVKPCTNPQDAVDHIPLTRLCSKVELCWERAIHPHGLHDQGRHLTALRTHLRRGAACIESHQNFYMAASAYPSSGPMLQAGNMQSRSSILGAINFA